MVLAISSETARATRHEGVLYKGTRYWRSDFVGHRKSGRETPQAYLIEQEPGSVVPPHCHETNRFQVVVKGDGKLGRHELRTFAIHFGGSHTAYGPIHASPEGLFYFALRAKSDLGAKFLPESKDKLRRVGRRNRMVETLPRDPVANGTPGAADPMLDSVLVPIPGPVLQPILEIEDDGLAAWLARGGAGASFAGPPPSEGGGQYCLVTGGSLHSGDGELPPWSCLCVSPAEAPLEITAGAGGMEAFILQFPKREAAEG